nr:ankyrin repeat domain-containing protein [Granulosicoccus sp.]
QGADINAQGSQRETALIIAGFVANRPELMKFLIERGADVNVANINGDTALIDAAYFGRNENLELLLENGAKPEMKNKQGLTAMDVAKKNEHKSTVKLLEAHGN